MRGKAEILRNNISHIVRSSIFIQSWRILAVLIFLLVVLFLLTPNEAYVNVEIESNSFVIDELKEINSDYIIEKFDFYAEFCDRNLINWHNGTDGMGIELWHNLPIVNGEVIGDGWPMSISIRPSDDISFEERSKVRIQKEENNSFFHCKTDFSNSSVSSDCINIYPDLFSKEREGYFSKGTQFEIEESGNMVILVTNCTVKFDVDSGFSRQYNEKELKILIPANTTIHFRVSDYSPCFHNITQIQSKIRSIKDMSLFGDGNISVTYTADSKDYKVSKQPIILHSKNSNLSLSLSQIKDGEQSLYSVSAYGFADQIYTANISLIPSFFSWFKENVYLLPTIFVTVITGSIQLIKTNKEKKDSDSKERKE